MQILLVERHKIVRKISSKIIQNSFNADVIEANNGLEGLKKFQMSTSVIDLVISDIRLPIMDGVEMIEKIRAKDKKVKIVAISMIEHSPTIRAVLKHNVCGYVFKEGNIQELIHAIKIVLEGGYYYSGVVKEIIRKDAVGL